MSYSDTNLPGDRTEVMYHGFTPSGHRQPPVRAMVLRTRDKNKTRKVIIEILQGYQMGYHKVVRASSLEIIR